MPEQFPIFIPTRDRLEPLTQLLSWIDASGQREIWLVDNMSTYPPLLEFLDASPHRVVRLEHNLGHRSPFLSGTVQRQAHGRYFVVSDPDVVPDESCPLDALGHFRRLFDRHPGIDKIGFGLRIDDLPDHYALRSAVVEWERQFWRDEVEPGVFRADIDTTFAMYRPLERHHEGSRSLRTGAPYLARHLPWYANSGDLGEEELYYRARADPTVSNWNREHVARWKLRRLEARRAQASF